MIDQERQQKEIDKSVQKMVDDYPRLWTNMIEEWQHCRHQDKMWLMYSANYLFCTDNINWAVDPATLSNRIPSVLQTNIKDLSSLSFVLLTHDHADHLDYKIIQQLSKSPVKWVVPEDMVGTIKANSGIVNEQLIIAHYQQEITIEGIKVTPFAGLHLEENIQEVSCTGYLVETANKRLLFPADVRKFNNNLLPQFGHIDTVFAHLWLGRNNALLTENPFLDQFCRFYLDFTPRQIMVTHLEEPRGPDNYWNQRHAQMALEHWHHLAPEVKITIPKLGKGVTL